MHVCSVGDLQIFRFQGHPRCTVYIIRDECIVEIKADVQIILAKLIINIIKSAFIKENICSLFILRMFLLLQILKLVNSQVKFCLNILSNVVLRGALF